MRDKITLECDIYNACRTNTGRAQLNDGHYDLNKLANISGANFENLIIDLQWCAERKMTDMAIQSVQHFAEAILSAYEIQENSYR